MSDTCCQFCAPALHGPSLCDRGCLPAMSTDPPKEESACLSAPSSMLWTNKPTQKRCSAPLLLHSSPHLIWKAQLATAKRIDIKINQGLLASNPFHTPPLPTLQARGQAPPHSTLSWQVHHNHCGLAKCTTSPPLSPWPFASAKVTMILERNVVEASVLLASSYSCAPFPQCDWDKQICIFFRAFYFY